MERVPNNDMLVRAADLRCQAPRTSDPQGLLIPTCSGFHQRASQAGSNRRRTKRQPLPEGGSCINQIRQGDLRGTIARALSRCDSAATTATSPARRQGQGTGSRNVAHGEGGVGQVGATGVEVAGAGVGPGGAFSEGELGDEDRSAFDGGRGVRVKVATVVGLEKPSPLMRAANASLDLQEAGGELGLTAVGEAFTDGDPRVAGRAKHRGRQQELLGTRCFWMSEELAVNCNARSWRYRRQRLLVE